MLWLGRVAGLGAAGAAAAALLFAVHPMHTASVVWLAERKNLLSLCLALLAAGAYLRFARSGSVAWLLSTCVFFALALLSKSAVAPLPLLLAPLATWRLKACPKRAWLGVIPLLVLAAGASALTVLRETETGTSALPLAERPLIAAAAAWFYLGKLLAPLDLSPLYGRWAVSSTWPPGWAALAAGVAACGLIAAFAGRLPRVLVWSSAWFLLLLAPALHLVPFDFAVHAFVADHLPYAASVGVCIALGWTAGQLLDAARPALLRALTGGALAVAVGAMLIGSWQYGARWQEAGSFWRWLVRRVPDSATAHYGFGVAALRAGQANEAALPLETAVSLRPGFVEAWDALGVAWERLGDPNRALAACGRAIRLREDFGPAHLHLGEILGKLGRLEEAERHARRARSLLPTSADAETLAGLLAEARGDQNEAISHYERAVAIEPDHAVARSNMGGALARRQRFAEAERHLRIAVQRDPGLVPAWTNLGHAQLSQQRPADALASFAAALRIAPADLNALRGYADACFALASPGDAIPTLVAARNRLRAAGDEASAAQVQQIIDRLGSTPGGLQGISP